MTPQETVSERVRAILKLNGIGARSLRPLLGLSYATIYSRIRGDSPWNDGELKLIGGVTGYTPEEIASEKFTLHASIEEPALPLNTLGVYHLLEQAAGPDGSIGKCEAIAVHPTAGRHVAKLLDAGMLEDEGDDYRLRGDKGGR